MRYVLSHLTDEEIKVQEGLKLAQIHVVNTCARNSI